MRQIVLLRGINIGPSNRIAMSQLRELLASASSEEVRTYLQSGNVVLASDASPEDLARETRRRIADAFGLDIAVLVRSGEELAAVVERDPLGSVALDPKRYQVSFLSAELDPPTLQRLHALAAPEERIVAGGRELYCWHPGGVARSKLWNELAGPRLGVTVTSRNWTTVTSLLAMARA